MVERPREVNETGHVGDPFRSTIETADDELNVHDTSPPIRKTYSGKMRPHLVSEAVRAIEYLTDNQVPVTAQETACLLILCDKVSSTHGQWYGSLSKLAERLPWERHWYSKWLQRLAEKGLVENLGTMPGRKLDTWQLLPWLYPVPVEADSATSHQPDPIEDGGSVRYQPLVEASGTALVEASVAALVEDVATTNTYNTFNTTEEHPLTVRPAAAQRMKTEKDFLIHAGDDGTYTAHRGML